MLAKFSVTNFKGFNKEFILDLSGANDYKFNAECVENGIIKNAMVYGKNGVGKSNLGLAVFDIISHLTDKQSNERLYRNYLNAENGASEAEFCYEFLFNSKKVVYKYKKTGSKTLISEEFFIDGEVFASTYGGDDIIIKFKGAENLIKDLEGNLSLLKYINNNTILDDDPNNRMFKDFYNFIERMLFFRSLRSNSYIGLRVGDGELAQHIIENDLISGLETFLNNADIKCKLEVLKGSEEEKIAFSFGDKQIEFSRIASQGTKALVLFYVWLQEIKKENGVSFLFIDEFDAFYHHELSASIVQELKKANTQFILTTHNTSIMTNDLLRPDCYFIMSNDKINSFSKCTEKELREAHNIEKMYKAGLFNAE